jgi:hypothetical protein
MGYGFRAPPTQGGTKQPNDYYDSEKEKDKEWNEQKTNTRTGACAEGAPQQKWAGIQEISETYHAMITCQGLRDTRGGRLPEGARTLSDALLGRWESLKSAVPMDGPDESMRSSRGCGGEWVTELLPDPYPTP